MKHYLLLFVVQCLLITHREYESQRILNLDPPVSLGEGFKSSSLMVSEISQILLFVCCLFIGRADRLDQFDPKVKSPTFDHAESFGECFEPLSSKGFKKLQYCNVVLAILFYCTNPCRENVAQLNLAINFHRLVKD